MDLAALYQAEWGRLLSLLVARTRRLDLAEDALSEAFARAVARWPSAGAPTNPVGWLYTTAYRQVLGWLRAEEIAGRKAPLLAVRPDWVVSDRVVSDRVVSNRVVSDAVVSDAVVWDDTDESLSDDQLHLILLCCHPALPAESRSALALRLVIGTSTEQVAQLFGVSNTTMAARLTRAKKKIAYAGIPLAAPIGNELEARLDEVCRTIYLAFTAGYTPRVGPELLRADLAGDAVSLAAVLHSLTPDASQVQAMRALLILQHSRRNARVRNGRLVTLANQDRARWHHDEIRVGIELVAALRTGNGYAEELRLQALIAAEHACAPSAEATNWNVVAQHYNTLETLTRSPFVRLNRAVAVAEAKGATEGLALLSGLDAALPGNHRVAAVRGELARRAGDTALAIDAFRRAITFCSNDIERLHLQEQLDALTKDAPT